MEIVFCSRTHFWEKIINIFERFERFVCIDKILISEAQKEPKTCVYIQTFFIYTQRYLINTDIIFDAREFTNETDNGQDGYAGSFGKTIDRFQLW